MSKNADIRGFFSKKTSQPSVTVNHSLSHMAPSSQQTRRPISVSPSREPSLNLLSSPVTPQKRVVKTPLTRDTEIKGSDDDDSDDSLESLGEMYGRKPKPTFQRPAAQTTTPRAKRVASGSLYFHRSPMTIRQQPKHKFDMKTLAAHSNQVKATEESSKRAEAAKAKAEKELEPEADPDKLAGETGNDEDDNKGDKLAMAIDRTAGDESCPRIYFFSQEEPPRSVLESQFPKKSVKTKPWSILQDASSRKQMFIHGIPTALTSKGKELPDELYMWVLDEICVEKDLQLRNQYLKLASLCHDDTRRLVNEEQLYKMLEKIGGPKHPNLGDRFVLLPGLPDPYPGRDWSHLRYFLELLTMIAPNLASESNVDAIKLLLCLSLDPIITTVVGLQASYSKAMLALVSALPTVGGLWNCNCESICSYLYDRVEHASQRYIAISLLPTSTPRMVELQRRLASEALLERPTIGRTHPDDVVTIQNIFTRLSEPDFQVAGSTDFGELNALISLLDIVIHDGSYLYRAHLSALSSSASSRQAPFPTPTTLTSPSTTPSPTSEAEARSRYDQDIDVIIKRLKVLHDKISDNTLVSKKEAKLALDGLMKRLTYTVRSRPPPKTSIFDGILANKEDTHLPRQKDFMKKWAAAKKAENKDEDKSTNQTGSSVK